MAATGPCRWRQWPDRSLPDQPVFKRIRIAILLYILLFVAAGEYLSMRRSTDWDNSLRVNVYLVNGSGTQSVERYIGDLGPDAFASIEHFYQGQARAYGIDLDAPFRIRLAGRLDRPLPPIPDRVNMFSSIVWSLRMRWFVTRLHFSSDLRTPDITLFAVYHDAENGLALDRSTALRKGMIAVANLFAESSADGSNGMVVAHELLHTLGASDKYDPATALPLFPVGVGDPDRRPHYPQSSAEIMAGRVALTADSAVVPRSLAEVVVGPWTADEIGWAEMPPAAR
jgi:hypothetical protein